MKKFFMLLCIPLTNFPMKSVTCAVSSLKTTYLSVVSAKKLAQQATNLMLPVFTHKKVYNFTCAHIAMNYILPDPTKLLGAIGRPLAWFNKKLLSITAPVFIFATWYKITYEQETLHKETQDIVNNNTTAQVKKVSDKLIVIEDLITNNTKLLEKLRDDAITKEEFDKLFMTTDTIKETVNNIDKNKLDTSHFDHKIDSVLDLIKTTNKNTIITKNNTFDMLRFIGIMQNLLEQNREKNELLKKALSKKNLSQDFFTEFFTMKKI